MAQHFLLSSQARSFNLVKIARMTERQAESYFRKVRWANLTDNVDLQWFIKVILKIK